MKIATGQRITCKHPTEAYYSNYGITPELIFSPGMVAVVKTISPKVCLPSKICHFQTESIENRILLLLTIQMKTAINVE